MDYKYIEQLLERYWNCQTTLEEESILRSFFTQNDIPAGMLKYKDLFQYQSQQTEEESLGEEFDERIIKIVNGKKHNKNINFSRLIPLFRAAAIVCFFLTIGMIVENSMNYRESINAKSELAEVQDTASAVDQSVAYDDITLTDSINVLKN